MIQTVRYGVMLLLLCVGWPAFAASVQVQDQVLQQGIFLKDGCNASAVSQEEYNNCVCESDIHFPQVSGLLNKNAESALNKMFRSDVEAMQCEGKQLDTSADKTKYGDDHASSTQHYDVTFQSEKILSLSFSDTVYSGGIQGDTKINGMIIDINKGEVLSITDLFSLGGLQAANTLIYDTLSAKPEGEVTHEQVDSHKGAFITEKGCNGCTLIAQQDGMHVVFKPYEISPSIANQAEVVLPFKLLQNPELFATSPVNR